MRGCLVLRENVSPSGEVGSGATPPRPLAARQQQVPRRWRGGRGSVPRRRRSAMGALLDQATAFRSRLMKKPPGGGAGGCLRGCFGSSGVRPRYNSSACLIPTVGASRCQAPFVGSIKNFARAPPARRVVRANAAGSKSVHEAGAERPVSDGRTGSAPSSPSRLRSTRPRERQATKGPAREQRVPLSQQALGFKSG